MKHTYEVTIGVFYDSHTTGAVECVTVRAENIFRASDIAWHTVKFTPFVQGANPPERREVVRIQRIA